MNTPPRLRLNLTIDTATSRRLSALSRRFGFRSPSTLGAAMVARIAQLMEAAPEAHAEEEIARLFQDMAEWQRTNGNRHDMNQRL